MKSMLNLSYSSENNCTYCLFRKIFNTRVYIAPYYEVYRAVYKQNKLESNYKPTSGVSGWKTSCFHFSEQTTVAVGLRNYTPAVSL